MRLKPLRIVVVQAADHLDWLKKVALEVLLEQAGVADFVVSS